MAAELSWHLTGGAANDDPDASLGGARSAAGVAQAAMNNLFDNVRFWEGMAGRVEYRACDLVNGGDAAAAAVTVWLDPNTTSENTVLELGLGGLESAQAVADEAEAPEGVAFAPHGPGAPLDLPGIPAGQGCRVWFRRTVSPEAAQLAEDTAWIWWEWA